MDTAVIILIVLAVLVLICLILKIIIVFYYYKPDNDYHSYQLIKQHNDMCANILVHIGEQFHVVVLPSNKSSVEDNYLYLDCTKRSSEDLQIKEVLNQLAIYISNRNHSDLTATKKIIEQSAYNLRYISYNLL